jgi:hypothetical protein
MQALTDADRVWFLKDLDNSAWVEVSDWEANFIESNLDETRFTPNQRKIIDQMIQKYRPG